MQNHHHHYAMNDLPQLVNGPGPAHSFPSLPSQPTAELFPAHYEVMMFAPRDIMPRAPHPHASFSSVTDSVAAAAAAAAAATITVPTPPPPPPPPSATPPITGFEADAAPSLPGDASTGRWPRQETLTLLEIRSRLDPKFKEANQKGPLWDEVSRIMSEEHGYQRSGKKCREKFENLYKYYKKTKEGKAGRHDGKHYRFFRQLEAIYGENSNTVSVPETNVVVSSTHFQTSNNHAPSSQTNNQEMSHKHCDSLSLTNSIDLDNTSSCDDDDDDDDETDHHGMENDESMRRKRKSGRRSWKLKIKDFIDSQMRKLVEKQKEWLEKLVMTMEEKEKERVLREEEWRKQEAKRLEREQKFWAKERAWIEARDAALMEALQKLTGREIMKIESHHHHDDNDEGTNVMGNEVRRNHRENQNYNEDGSEILNSTSGVMRGVDNSWPESEITRLQQLRTEMETRFPQSEFSEEVTWEEVATKMDFFGYERSALMCKEKWESIVSNYPRDHDGNKEENNKKRKEYSRSFLYFKNNNIGHDHQPSLYNLGSAYCDDINDQRHHEIERLKGNDGSSPSNSNVAPPASCFPFLMSTEGGNLWENYGGLKLYKANQNH